jgi:hypothetical protein
MKIRAKDRGRVQYDLTDDEARAMISTLRPACLAETLGPNWKDIFWTPNRRPYVKK